MKLITGQYPIVREHGVVEPIGYGEDVSGIKPWFIRKHNIPVEAKFRVYHNPEWDTRELWWTWYEVEL